MKWSEDEVREKLQELLDECMDSMNQYGSLKITRVEFENDDKREGSGDLTFTWCTPEPKNKQPYFTGY